ncbi:MAG: hypothetical protein QM296_03015, partial [Bacillota bacterium]|nr:hypothetical protein [Bacillota bacterium]
ICSRGGQKLRWCPEIRAGAKKLSTAGQKLRWCPGIRAGTKKLSTGGQKMRWCPGIRAGTKKLTTAGNNCAGVLEIPRFLTTVRPPKGGCVRKQAVDLFDGAGWVQMR